MIKNLLIKNKLFIIVIVFILLLSRFVLCIGLASGESMEPTIHSGSILLINRLPIHYQRNDIVLCKCRGTQNITKRIIGLPGETITITTEGQILINNTLYSDPYGYVSFPMFLDGDRSYPVILSNEEYFVMGDNRNVSKDSRFSTIGNIKSKNILGKVFYFFSLKSSM